MHDANAAVVAIFGARRYESHRSPVVLEKLARLELVVEPGRRTLGRLAVDVEDVVEGVCHNVWANNGPEMRVIWLCG